MSTRIHSATVHAPATVANVGSAFDVLGFALEAPEDIVTVSISDKPGITIQAIHGDDGRLPLDPTRNTAAVSIQALLQHLQRCGAAPEGSIGLTLEIRKGLPIGSGLGSSSASTVAGVVAANELLRAPLSRRELLPFAMEGERIACGTAHADNVAPCLLGGFVLVRSYNPLDVIELPIPKAGSIAVVTPHVELRTADARKILKKMVPLESAVTQWGNVAALVAGIYTGDLELMGRALEDTIIEPERGQLIPGYQQAKLAAKNAAALGCSISGSGPSMFALCRDTEHARYVAQSMADAFSAQGIGVTHRFSGINRRGALVVEKR